MQPILITNITPHVNTEPFAAKSRPLITRIIGHFKTICIHKFWVLYYCCKMGIPFQGLIHDLSKFTPTEFFESVKYYTGAISPIVTAKLDKGYSTAWFHHKGRNKHHYEYWMDNFDKGGENILMPKKYALEQICDYLAAGKAYQKKDFSFQSELTWWQNRIQNPIAIHPSLQTFTTNCLVWMAEHNKIIPKQIASEFYDHATQNT